MAITSGLFNSINGDRLYNDKWFARYFATFIGNGVFPKPSTGLQVLEESNMRTVVKAGDGWINGYFIVNDGDYILQHDLADGALKRIDRVVMRLNYQTRMIEIVIKKGTYASSPVAPGLQRDPDAYELALADVLIDRGATQIKQSHITDLRLNKNLCGIVHGTVDQVDTTTLFNQYQSWFAQYSQTNAQAWEAWQAAQSADFDAWQAQEKANFDAWFRAIQDILDENIVTNLLTLIEGNTNALIAYKAEKGKPNGYPGLDASGKVPIGQLPPMDYIPLSQKGAANGVATLGANGRVPNKQLGYYIPSDTILKTINGPPDPNGAQGIFQVYQTFTAPFVGSYRVKGKVTSSASGQIIVYFRITMGDLRTVASNEVMFTFPGGYDTKPIFDFVLDMSEIIYSFDGLGKVNLEVKYTNSTHAVGPKISIITLGGAI